MHKGVVFEINPRYAVVVTDDMRYLRINRKVSMRLGKEILFLPEDLSRERNTFVKMASVAAIFLLILFSAFLRLNGRMLQIIDQSAAAVLSMDFNPSIQMDINGSGKVIRLTPVTAESGALLNTCMIGEESGKVVANILQNAIREGYLASGGQDVLIAVNIFDYRTGASAVVSEVSRAIVDTGMLSDVKISYLETTSQELEGARADGISLGREALYRKILQNGFRFTIEQIKQMRVGDLLKMQLGIPRDASVAPTGGSDSAPQSKIPDNSGSQAKPFVNNKGGPDGDNGNSSIVEKVSGTPSPSQAAFPDDENPGSKGNGGESSVNDKPANPTNNPAMANERKDSQSGVENTVPGAEGDGYDAIPVDEAGNDQLNSDGSRPADVDGNPAPGEAENRPSDTNGNPPASADRSRPAENETGYGSGKK